jgi:hypothetical protein
MGEMAKIAVGSLAVGTIIVQDWKIVSKDGRFVYVEKPDGTMAQPFDYDYEVTVVKMFNPENELTNIIDKAIQSIEDSIVRLELQDYGNGHSMYMAKECLSLFKGIIHTVKKSQYDKYK